MDLALLELTETAAGEVLQNTTVVTVAALAREPAPRAGVINRLRLFARMEDVHEGVPASLVVHLNQAAQHSLDPVRQLVARPRRGGPRNPSAPFVALWQDGRLQELRGRTLAESLEGWLRGTAPGAGEVVIYLSDPALAAVEAAERSVERYYAQLRVGLGSRPVSHFATGEVVGTLTIDDPEVVIGTPDPSPRVDTLTPAQQIARDAAAKREALASGWPTAAEVSAQLGSAAENGSHLASRLRRAGQLLGVYLPLPAPSYRYPSWQFHENGQPVDHLTEILAVLRDHGPFEREPDGQRRTTGWGEVEWFRSPHVLLDGAAPAEVLASDPARVLQAARTEFEDEA